MVFLKSARSVETVTKSGYHRCDRGLYLQVSGTGTKSWIFRYKSPVTSRQREMGIGSNETHYRTSTAAGYCST